MCTCLPVRRRVPVACGEQPAAVREAELFTDLFRRAREDRALAATLFHSGQIPIPSLKAVLAQAGIAVRSRRTGMGTCLPEGMSP